MSKSNPYAPLTNVQCPSPNSNDTTDQLFRTFFPQNQTLHSAEQAYIQQRKPIILKAWKEWIQGPEIGYNMSQFEPDSYPTVGMALSGGGFRASLFGAGVLNAYDARNATSKALGTGGLYNVASYVAGASGGSWVIGSKLFNPNSKSFFNLALGVGEDGEEQGWLLDINIALPNGDNFLDSKNEEFYGAIVANAKAKAATSIPVSITDIWAGLISYHFLNGTTRDNFFNTESLHGAGSLWSHVPSTLLFQTQSIPYPLVVTDSRAPSSTGERPSLNDVVYEISPFEWGSWDPTLSTMSSLKFAGTFLNEGKPSNSTACVTGFDQAAHILGSSSNLWDAVGVVLDSEFGNVAQILGPLGDVLEKLIAKITVGGEDTALWPNAFGGLNKGVFENALTSTLRLDDGAENAANVPIEPLMLKPRKVDVVVAIDATAEHTFGERHNYPNGTAMNTSVKRLQTVLSQTHFQPPPIPSDFALTGNNLHVSFFGCDLDPNDTDSSDTPLLIYVPNSPPCTGENPVTNTGSLQPSYSVLHQTLFFTQAFQSATCGFVLNATTADPNLPLCLKCAALDRARLHSKPPIPRSSICQQCFTQYCFTPSNPLSHLDFPGRKFIFVDPSPPSSFSLFTSFLRKDGIPLFIVIGILGALSICVCSVFAVRRGKRRKEKLKLVKMYGWGALVAKTRKESEDEERMRLRLGAEGIYSTRQFGRGDGDNRIFGQVLDSGMDIWRETKQRFGFGLNDSSEPVRGRGGRQLRSLGKGKGKGKYRQLDDPFEFELEYGVDDGPDRPPGTGESSNSFAMSVLSGEKSGGSLSPPLPYTNYRSNSIPLLSPPSASGHTIFISSPLTSAPPRGIYFPPHAASPFPQRQFSNASSSLYSDPYEDEFNPYENEFGSRKQRSVVAEEKEKTSPGIIQVALTNNKNIITLEPEEDDAPTPPPKDLP